MHISLSQESPKMCSADQNFITKFQQLQKSQVNDITVTTKPQQKEIVSSLRRAIKIAEDSKIVLDYCKTRIK